MHVKMLELQLGQDKLRERIRKLEESKVDEIETRVQDALQTPASQETIKKLVKDAGPNRQGRRDKANEQHRFTSSRRNSKIHRGK